MDEVVSSDLGMLIYDQVRKFVARQGAAKSASTSEQETTTASGPTGDAEGPPELRDEIVASEMAWLDRAFFNITSY